MTTRILYTGPGLVGVRTTVTFLGLQVRPPFQPLRSGQGPWAMALQLPTYGKVNLTIRTDVRSNRWFPNFLASASGGPEYAAVVDYLRVVDAIVFVADSQFERADADAHRVATLAQDLPALGRPLSEIPVVFQCNKRDLAPPLMSMKEMKERLRWPCCAHVPSVATTGEGVLEALAELLRLKDNLKL